MAHGQTLRRTARPVAEADHLRHSAAVQQYEHSHLEPLRASTIDSCRLGHVDPSAAGLIRVASSLSRRRPFSTTVTHNERAVTERSLADELDAMYAALLRSGGRRGQGLSMTTVHHLQAVVDKMLHDAERKGLVTRNVARLANPPSLTTARSKGPEMRVWSPGELTSFLASIEGKRNEALFVCSR